MVLIRDKGDGGGAESRITYERVKSRSRGGRVASSTTHYSTSNDVSVIGT